MNELMCTGHSVRIRRSKKRSIGAGIGGEGGGCQGGIPPTKLSVTRVDSSLI